MGQVELCCLNKYYGRNHVVRNVSLEVHQGEFLTLLGPSGCGKSTTLRMIAGFETIDSGKVLINGRDLSNTAANRRGIGMVFQSYALFPNMTSFENVAFGLKMQRMDIKAIHEKAYTMLTEVGLEAVADHYPHQLSGGQQQRVALARALVREPDVLLLDEPLSALDARLRIQLREMIRDLQRGHGITTIYVTHDQEEALSISDRIAVMNQGTIVQLGTPGEIYAKPTDPFVATFVGTLNRLDGQLVDSETGTIDVAGQRLVVPGLIGRSGQIALGIRPERIRICTDNMDARPGEAVFGGTLKTVSLFGSVIRMTVLVGGHEIKVDVLNGDRILDVGPGEKVYLGIFCESLLALE